MWWRHVLTALEYGNGLIVTLQHIHYLFLISLILLVTFFLGMWVTQIIDIIMKRQHHHQQQHIFQYTHIHSHTYQVVFWAFRYQKIVNLLARFDIYDFILSKTKCRCLLWWNTVYVKCKWKWTFRIFRSDVFSNVKIRDVYIQVFADKFNDNMDMLIIHEIWLLLVIYIVFTLRNTHIQAHLKKHGFFRQ